MTVMWNFRWDSAGWRDRAACRYTDPNLFFPLGSTGDAVEQIQAAKAVCCSCPVREPCLQFAFETNQESGVWGGTDETERRSLRRLRRVDRRPRELADM